MGEGWFPTFDDVPKQAISMSIKQIMKSKAIICSVPDNRKADAVKKAQLPNQKYSQIRSNNRVQTRNFYLLTLLEKLPDVNLLISKDEVFSKMTLAKKEDLSTSLKNCGDNFVCYL